MAGPIVAYVGATGNIGKPQIPAFLEALSKNRIKELRILVSQGKGNDELVQKWKSQGAKIVEISYSDISSLTKGLAGVDVCVSVLKGPYDFMLPTWNNLLEAIAQAGVKIYFPSEFDAALETSPRKEYSHPWWDFKRKHFKEAKAKGIKPVRMATGCVPEFIMAPFFGYDMQNQKWTVVGNAADTYVSVISHDDIGKFTCEAVLYAFKDPSSCPEEFEVCSDVRTLREYASIMDKVLGSGKTTFESIPLETTKAEYEATTDPLQKFLVLVRLMMAEGGFDYRKSKGNELLNPGQSKWKLMKLEEYGLKERLEKYLEGFREREAVYKESQKN